MFLVDSRIKGKGERFYLHSRREADTKAQLLRTRLKNEGGSAFDDSSLLKYGWTVQRAIRFALDHLEKQSTSIPVPDAIERLIASKSAAGRRADYCGDLRRRLTRFADYADKRTIGEFKAPDIEAFLTSLNVAEGTWNTYRRDLVTLWSFSVKAGLVPVNEAMKSERASEIDKAPGILTPAQAAALLMASNADDVLACHAIGLFAGLRGSELAKLEWDNVDLESGFIHISAATSKTRSRRLVPILDNLRSWITPIAKTSGRIQQTNFRRRSGSVRKAAGIIPWPDNALRHSFVSYRLADTGNAAQTALEAGHDQAILFRHYRELVKPKDAARYWSIKPCQSSASKVVSMKGA